MKESGLHKTIVVVRRLFFHLQLAGCRIMSHHVSDAQVILMQEKEIHDLKLQVQSLQEQLKNCKSGVPSNSPSRLTSLEQESDTRVTRRGELEESAPHKSTKLRGSVRTARNDKLSERPSELLTVDAFEMADDDEEKLGDR